MNATRGKFFTLLVATLTLSFTTNYSARAAQILYESGTLGPTGVSWQDVADQVVLGENVKATAFNGVRFKLTQPVATERIGGHFVGLPGINGNFFGAIIRLIDENDFPDSADLSTPDVLGHTLLTFPGPSSEVFGDINLFLNTGWYGLVFGSGLFGATSEGAALLNNADLNSPEYIGFLSGFGWGNRLPNKRYVVEGVVVPEPSVTVLTTLVVALAFSTRIPRR